MKIHCKHSSFCTFAAERSSVVQLYVGPYLRAGVNGFNAPPQNVENFYSQSDNSAYHSPKIFSSFCLHIIFTSNFKFVTAPLFAFVV